MGPGLGKQPLNDARVALAEGGEGVRTQWLRGPKVAKCRHLLGWRSSTLLPCWRSTPLNSAPTCSEHAEVPRQARQAPRASTCACCLMTRIVANSCTTRRSAWLVRRFLSKSLPGFALAAWWPSKSPRGYSGLRVALVMGDVFRRLVSRTLAQQLSAQLQEACAPYQYALTGFDHQSRYAQEAQCAAGREASADRKPSPPKCRGNCARRMARPSKNGGASLANNAPRQVRTASSWRRAKAAVAEGGKARSR